MKNTNMTIKKQLNDLFAKHKKELEDTVSQYLLEAFKPYFEKYPKAESVKVSAYQSYNDNDYNQVVGNDSDNIAVNGHSYISLENEDFEDDEFVENIKMTREEHENAADDASAIFEDFPDDILLRVFGNEFGLKVTRTTITIESSDIENYY